MEQRKTLLWDQCFVVGAACYACKSPQPARRLMPPLNFTSCQKADSGCDHGRFAEDFPQIKFFTETTNKTCINCYKTTKIKSSLSAYFVQIILQLWPQKINFRTAMSDRNCLLSQNLCNYLNQGRTLNDLLMKVAHWTIYFDLSRLNLV